MGALGIVGVIVGVVLVVVVVGCRRLHRHHPFAYPRRLYAQAEAQTCSLV